MNAPSNFFLKKSFNDSANAVNWTDSNGADNINPQQTTANMTNMSSDGSNAYITGSKYPYPTETKGRWKKSFSSHALATDVGSLVTSNTYNHQQHSGTQ